MVAEEGDGQLLLSLLLLPLVSGLLSHFLSEPPARAWHRTLYKSPYTPPGTAFPLVWLSNYVSMGYASYLAVKAWRVEVPDPFTRNSIVLAYFLHLLLLNTWNPIFFRLRRIDLALFNMCALDVGVAALIGCVAHASTLAALICVPYLTWLLLLTYFNFYMMKMNPGPHFGPTKNEIIKLHQTPIFKSE